MSKTVSICCRLPSGLLLQVGNKFVELAGQRQAQERSPIILLSQNDYGVTEVDAEFWEAWVKQVGEDYAPLKTQAIFEAANTKEVAAKVKDVKKEKTGHEPLPQMDKDIEAVK